MPKPDFFIVGAPKCGTTSMYEYLYAHPDIFMPTQKEMHYFGSDLDFRSPLILRRRNPDAYLSYFSEWSGERRVGEASVLYMASTRAAQEIYDYEPNARILIMLRNPVDMLYSWYYQLCFTGVEDQPTFEEALALEEDRKRGLAIPETVNWVGTLYYRDMARYSVQIQRYFDVFPREQIHIILLDDLKADTKNTYKKVLEFLDVDPSFYPDFAVANASKKVRNPQLRNFLSYPPEWYQTLLSIGKKVFPGNMRQWVNRRIKNYNTIPFRYPPMQPETRQQLTEEFKLEVQTLSKMLNRDLSHWHTS